MADTDGEDGYMDDDLDALISSNFLELQERAIRSTQQQRQPLREYQGVRKVTGLKPEIPISGDLQGLGSRAVEPRPEAYPDLPSSDYGDLDEEVFDASLINGRKGHLIRQVVNGTVHGPLGEATQREQWRQQRYSVPERPKISSQARPEPWSQQAPGLPDRGRSSVKSSPKTAGDGVKQDLGSIKNHDGHNITGDHHTSDALQVKIKELLRERKTLQLAVQAAKDQALAKAGEISIVRNNQVKTVKEHERVLKELQKHHTDVIVRQNMEIENIRTEREKLITEKKYLQHDLTEESERARQFQRAAKGVQGGNVIVTKSFQTNAPGTPKKNVVQPFRDGFDDDEIMARSPSRTPGKAKLATPKAGDKRKRNKPDASPSQPLQLSQPRGESLPRSPVQVKSQQGLPLPVKLSHKPDHRFQFTQKVLNHRIAPCEQRSFEALADFAFPSKPEAKLSTLLLDKVTLLGSSQNIDDFPTSIASILTFLWAQCITEEYYKPLSLLLDFVKFILLSNSVTGPSLMDEVIDLAQKTADINVIPRFQRFRAASTSSRGKEPNDDVNVTECLEILYLIAMACVRSPDNIARFWRLMRYDFILMLLRNSQPIEDTQLMLRLLSTSVQETTFAMITDPAIQVELEQHIIDRTVAMLIDVPRKVEGEQPYDILDVAEMRLQILYLMEKICEKKHGGEALAKNQHAIGRLVRLMNDEINALYDRKFGHEQRAELVNQATRLLFHLTSAYRGIINMQEKLAVHPGGTYKHMIALTRLAFSEGLFFEQGIDDDVVDCAHQMLEDTVTPEEGEALLEVFSTSRR